MTILVATGGQKDSAEHAFVDSAHYLLHLHKYRRDQIRCLSISGLGFYLVCIETVQPRIMQELSGGPA